MACNAILKNDDEKESIDQLDRLVGLFSIKKATHRYTWSKSAKAKSFFHARAVKWIMSTTSLRTLEALEAVGPS